MATLRTAFLSALALELIATISVAVVAVFIGLRLLDGDCRSQAGLLVLILAPECFCRCVSSVRPTTPPRTDSKRCAGVRRIIGHRRRRDLCPLRTAAPGFRAWCDCIDLHVRKRERRTRCR